jgi:predicted Rossmann fold flavoprotein
LKVESTHDVIVLGAGAAGLFCAALAGQRGRRVVVLERNREPGRKILISGGGRCNFTNVHCRPEHFFSENPHFVRSALARYTPADFIALVDRHAIPYHEKTLGQLFCDGSSREIVDLLLEECRAGGVEIVTDCQVVSVERGFDVTAATGRYSAPALVVATGGLSIPKIGATDFGYRIAQQFGLAIVPTRPALVPLVLNDEDRRRWCDLAGVATDCVATAGTSSFRERLLITHRGLSGPAILQASSYWRPGRSIVIDLLPDIALRSDLAHRRAQGDPSMTKHAIAEYLPRRLADRWFDHMAKATPIAVTGDEALAALERGLHSWTLRPDDTEGFGKAEVTAGGVDTRELSSKTLESRRVPGLYFIGEVVDVTGHLGGFNFQWAWASAHAAALACVAPAL